jgi:hypothetical protein
MVVGLLFCLRSSSSAFYCGRKLKADHVLVKADRLVRTAGEPHKAN